MCSFEAGCLENILRVGFETWMAQDVCAEGLFALGRQVVNNEW